MVQTVMADDRGPLRRLEAELGSGAPLGLQALAAHELEHLAGSIAQTRRRQAQAIAAAGERSLRFVPRLLRGPIRKALGG